MFTRLLETEWSAELLRIADIERRREDERPENEKLYSIILDFITEFYDNAYVLDEVDMLFEGKTLRSFNVYVNRASLAANNLANTIADHFSFVVLKTMDPELHYTLLINNRPVVEIRDMEKLLEFEYLMPWKIKYKKWTLITLPPDVYLMEAYHKLYNPAFVDEWDEIRMRICHLEKLQEDGPSSIGATAVGGRQDISNIAMKVRMAIIKQLLGTEIARENFMIAGRTTVPLLGGNVIDYADNLQLISRLHINDAAQIIINFVEQMDGLKVHLVGQEMSVPFDFRMRKYIFYISFSRDAANGGHKDQRPLLELFTSAQYELVPYVSLIEVIPKLVDEWGDIRIAHPLVTLRLQYIDIWVLKLLRQNGKIGADKIQQLLAKKVSTIGLIKGSVGFGSPPRNWMGKWSNADTDYKIISMKKRKDASVPTYPYKPYLYYKQHGKYRVFT
jgi:hypothetical protein